MDIYQVVLGHMQNFVYVLSDPSTKDCAVVDPAWDVPHIIDYINQHQLNPKFVLLTHGHFDHVDGLESFLSRYDIPVYLSEKELPQLTPTVSQLVRTKDNDVIQLGAISLQVMHTPGHSPGGQCFYTAPHLVTGDTLFVDGCGRCDLPGSNVEDMYNSLQRIGSMPNDTVIYTGHQYGDKKTDTIGNQKTSNPYLTLPKETFLRMR